jgi:hypothetical protein
MRPRGGSASLRGGKLAAQDLGRALAHRGPKGLKSCREGPFGLYVELEGESGLDIYGNATLCKNIRKGASLKVSRFDLNQI